MPKLWHIFVVYLADLLMETMLFGYGLFIIFPRIQTVFEPSSVPLWTRFEDDVNMHVGIYFGFLFLFGLWVFYRTWKMRQERSERNDLQKTVASLITEIRGLRQDVRNGACKYVPPSSTETQKK